MKRSYWITVGLLGIAYCGLAQDNRQLLVKSVKHTVKDRSVTQLKWLTDDFDLSKEYHVFRRPSGKKKWKLLTPTPVKYKSLPLAPFLAEDRKVRDYLSLLEGADGPVPDIIRFGLIVKVLEANEFARYLGIAFDDSTAVSGATYDYKITEIVTKKSGKRKDIDLLEVRDYASSLAARQEPPRSIVFETLENKVEFYWIPEPDRYFGVNLFRAVKGEEAVKVNQDVIIPVESMNEEGFFDYPDIMYADSSLTLGVTYVYHLVAIDFFGIESTPSQSFEVTLTDKKPPKAPKIEKLVPHPDGRVEISWTTGNEPDLKGFTLYRFNGLEDSIRKPLTPEPIVSPAFEDRLTRSGIYRYQVVAEDYSGNKSESGIQMVQLKDKIPPAGVSDFTATLDSVFVAMRWDASPSEDVWGYRVYRSAFGIDENHFSLITDGIIRGYTYADTLPGHVKSAFTYKVVALDTSMNTSQGAYATLALQDYRAPGAPAMAGITNEAGNNILSWRKRREKDISHYTLYFAGFGSEDWQIIDTSKNNRFRINEAMDSGRWRITASDVTGNESPPSEEIIFKKDMPLVEPAYEKFELIPGEKEIKLQWSTTNDAVVRGHAVYRKSSEGAYKRISALISGNSFVDRPKAGGSYFYQLRGYTFSGKTIKSIENNITF
ncbi:MAG: hypothetical protein MI921_06710 [Cytophagales bacterium]|nr:hypothetical protein [Cytophagales bacterium]